MNPGYDGICTVCDRSPNRGQRFAGIMTSRLFFSSLGRWRAVHTWSTIGQNATRCLTGSRQGCRLAWLAGLGCGVQDMTWLACMAILSTLPSPMLWSHSRGNVLSDTPLCPMDESSRFIAIQLPQSICRNRLGRTTSFKIINTRSLSRTIGTAHVTEKTLRVLGSFAGETAAINHRYKQSRSTSHRLSYQIHSQGPYSVDLLPCSRKQASDPYISSRPTTPRRESFPMTVFPYLPGIYAASDRNRTAAPVADHVV